MSELNKNARIPLSKISKKIKKSKQLINYRIKNLEKRRVILGYNTIIDYSKLGYMSFRVYINLKSIMPKNQKEFVEFLKNQKKVWWLVSVENICDIAYAILVKDIYEFYDHLEKISKYNQFIKTKQIVIYSHIKQFPKAYILDKENTESGTLIGASKKEEIDDTDIKLLKIISSDGRIPLIELSSKLGMKPQSAMYRLKKLEKREVIKGYRININIELLGFKNYKIYLHLINTSKNKQIENYCKLNPFVVTTNKTIGGADFEIELQLSDINSFYKILDEIRERFSDVIESHEYGVAREDIKVVYCI